MTIGPSGEGLGEFIPKHMELFRDPSSWGPELSLTRCVAGLKTDSCPEIGQGIMNFYWNNDSQTPDHAPMISLEQYTYELPI